jgi:L-erythrulose 1-phosphate isomerase
MSDVLVAVSLKAYFGYSQTCRWLSGVARLLDRRPLADRVELAVLPPFPLLERTVQVLGPHGVQAGSQDVSWAEAGPMTGEVTAALLAELGCRYAEVGHAERRQHFGEDDAMTARKAVAAARCGLVPLICVGERHPDLGEALVEAVHQAGAVTEKLDHHPFVIAYEPLWAIGAGAPADADHVLRVGEALRSSIPALGGGTGRLIYGGTAGPGTLSTLRPCFDGVFLGRRAHRLEGLQQVLEEAESTT